MVDQETGEATGHDGSGGAPANRRAGLVSGGFPTRELDAREDLRTSAGGERTGAREGFGDGPAGGGPGEPGGVRRDTLEPSPIGEYLRRQRVLRGVTIEELCADTRIPLRSLERLERGEFDGETDGFVRGFVRTVAIALGLDPDDTIARMLREPAPGVWEGGPSGRRVKQGAVLSALAVVALIGFMLLQAGWRVLVEGDVEREVVVWRDPVRSLAEAAGVEVDPAGEIEPRSAPVAPVARNEPAP